MNNCTCTSGFDSGLVQEINPTCQQHAMTDQQATASLEERAKAYLALRDAATEGPWFDVRCTSTKHNGSVCAGALTNPIYIAMTTNGDDSDEGMDQRDADSEFIAASHIGADLLAEALQEIERLRKDAKRLEFVCTRMKGNESRRLFGAISDTGNMNLWRAAIDAALAGATHER